MSVPAPEPVAQPKSAYVLFIMELRQKQKSGSAEEGGVSGKNFLSDASKQWGLLSVEDKKRFQD